MECFITDNKGDKIDNYDEKYDEYYENIHSLKDCIKFIYSMHADDQDKIIKIIDNTILNIIKIEKKII